MARKSITYSRLSLQAHLNTISTLRCFEGFGWLYRSKTNPDFLVFSRLSVKRWRVLQICLPDHYRYGRPELSSQRPPIDKHTTLNIMKYITLYKSFGALGFWSGHKTLLAAKKEAAQYMKMHGKKLKIYKLV